jgi:NitT/TauT family transport system ATP-binding protein
MTNIPTQVRAVIEVDLPRPRHVENITESDEANVIKMKALGLLHEEAMKSFARGSKAAADFVNAYSKRMTKE